MADNVIVRVPEQQFIRGEDGYSPEVTIENIDHGHSVTITDRDHPNGQNFNVLDGDSAYEQAVAGGYTGTEAQFNEELASFKELSEQAADSAQQAASGASTAQYYMNSAWNAVNSANLAKVRAEAAADQALIRMNSADTSAQAAATTATTFTEQTVPAAVNTINEAKADALTAVGNAQTTAVGAVQQESTTQQAAIQQKGEDVLDSIPADYTELTEDVDDLKNHVTLYTGNAEIVFTDGYYINTGGNTVDITTPTASTTGYKYAIVPCSEGEKFTVTSSGGQNPRAWCFVDDSSDPAQAIPLTRADSKVAVTNLVITAPANATKLIINAKNAEKSYYGELIKDQVADLANRMSVIQIDDVQKAEIKNAVPNVPLTKFEVDLPVAPSNLNTPSLQNIVTYTLYDSIEAYLGETFGTALITKSAVLSTESEKIYGGSVDFANSKITKKYDSILLDGVTSGLKFTVSGSQYRLTNNKLSNAVNNYRCYATWLPPTVLRVNKNNHFTYGYASDFATLGFSSVDALNAMIQQEPLLVIFELDVPVVTIFDDVKAVLPSSNMTAWCNIGTLSVTYQSSFEDSTKSVIEKNRTNTYSCGTISSLPSYKIPSAMYYNPAPYFYDILGNVHAGDANYRTNGAGYDGKRYLYYCLGAGSTTYAIRKFDTWQKEVVLTRDPENIGHCETVTFIPAWCPGFDSGTVDRIYTTSFDSTGTVRVFSAKTLEYLTSFTTNNLVNSEYFTYVPILLFNQNRGKFVLSSQRTTIDGVPYITLSIASIDGTIEKCVRLKDAGTSCGFDADDNFIYMLKDISSSDVMLILDWELNPVTMAPFSCYDYEPEALYHIGDTFFMVSNIDNRQGIHIWEYYCTNTYDSTAPTFPMAGWNNSLIDSSSFTDVELQ